MATKPKILMSRDDDIDIESSREVARRRSGARASANHPFLTMAVVLTATAFSAPIGAQSVEEICSGSLEAFQQPPFESFDRDRDDNIERSESEGCRSLHTLFVELDVNDDERLSRVEYAAFAFLWAERARTFGLDR